MTNLISAGKIKGLSRACPGPLLHINYNISFKCSFNCLHCYSRLEEEHSFVKDELNLNQKLKVCKNIISSGVFSVNLGGGEPLECEDIYPVIEYLSKSGVQVSICSNGWGLTAEVAEKLKHAGLKKVHLSLDDSIETKHDTLRNRQDSFKHLLQAANNCRKTGIKIGISTTLYRDNFNRLDEIAEIAHRLNATSFEIKGLKPKGNAKLFWDKTLTDAQESSLYNEIKILKAKYTNKGLDVRLVYSHNSFEEIDDGCPCGRTVLAILPNGIVAPCVYSPRIAGNALTESLSDIWVNSKELNEFRSLNICAGLER